MLVFGVEEFGEAEVGYFDGAVVLEDVGEFEIAVHDFVFNESLEGVEDLDEVFDGLVLLQEFLLALEVAELEDEVDVVDGFLDVEQLDDVVVPAGLQHFDFVFEEFDELAYVSGWVPLIFVRLMVLTATSTPSTLL